MNCPRCQKTLSRKSAFIRHLRERHDPSPPRIECDLCSTTFTRLEHYRRHRRRQQDATLPSQYYECPVCPHKTFKRLHNLQRHLHFYNTLPTTGPLELIVSVQEPVSQPETSTEPVHQAKPMTRDNLCALVEEILSPYAVKRD